MRRLKCDDESDIEFVMDMIVCWLIFPHTKWEASSYLMNLILWKTFKAKMNSVLPDKLWIMFCNFVIFHVMNCDWKCLLWILIESIYCEFWLTLGLVISFILKRSDGLVICVELWCYLFILLLCRGASTLKLVETRRERELLSSKLSYSMVFSFCVIKSFGSLKNRDVGVLFNLSFC